MKFLRKLGIPFAYIALVGFIIWIGIYLWQATPIFMTALGPAVLWIASFLAVFFLGVLFLTLWIVLAWFWIALHDKRHFYETRKRYREESLRQQMLQHRPDYIIIGSPVCTTCPCLPASKDMMN